MPSKDSKIGDINRGFVSASLPKNIFWNQVQTVQNDTFINTNNQPIQMIKKPRRDLKVKSLFQDESNPQPISPEVDGLQSSDQNGQTTHAQPETHADTHTNTQSLQSSQVSSPQVTTPNLEILPVRIDTSARDQHIQIDIKKSKIQELKDKYLKKNTNINSTTKQQPNESRALNTPQTPQAPTPQFPVEGVVIRPETKAQKQDIKKQLLQPVKSEDLPPNNVQAENTQESQPYITDFNPIIKESFKPKTVPPLRRQIGPPKNPFELKGTYPSGNNAQYPVPINPSIQTNGQEPVKTLAKNRGIGQDLPILSKQLKVSTAFPMNIKPQVQHPNHNTQSMDVTSSPHSSTNQKQSQPTTFNFSNLTRNPLEFMNDLLTANMITQSRYRLCTHRLLDHPALTSQKFRLVSSHPQYNQWVQRLMTDFVLESQTINDKCMATVDDILGEFFMPLGGEFCPAFVVALCKLNHDYYQKYLDKLLASPQTYIEVLIKHTAWISRQKLSDFLLFIVYNLNHQTQNYSSLLLDVFLASPQSINDTILPRFVESASVQQSAIMLLLLAKSKIKFVRSNVVLANTVIKQMEERGQVESALELIKQLNQQLGPSAYTMFKETRERLIRQFNEPEPHSDTINQAKNVASNLFGLFSNVVGKMINTKPTEKVPNKPQSKQEPKDDIYFDPVKKRYVLNGQIPEDQTQTVSTNQPMQVPPPLPRSTVPPPAPLGNQSGKRQNRIPANRYV